MSFLVEMANSEAESLTSHGAHKLLASGCVSDIVRRQYINGCVLAAFEVLGARSESDVPKYLRERLSGLVRDLDMPNETLNEAISIAVAVENGSVSDQFDFLREIKADLSRCADSGYLLMLDFVEFMKNEKGEPIEGADKVAQAFAERVLSDEDLNRWRNPSASKVCDVRTDGIESVGEEEDISEKLYIEALKTENSDEEEAIRIYGKAVAAGSEAAQEALYRIGCESLDNAKELSEECGVDGLDDLNLAQKCFNLLMGSSLYCDEAWVLTGKILIQRGQLKKDSQLVEKGRRRLESAIEKGVSGAQEALEEAIGGACNCQDWNQSSGPSFMDKTVDFLDNLLT